MQAHHWSRRGSRTRERTNARLALASNGVRCPSASTPTVCKLITKVRRLSCNVQLPVLSELTYSACTTTSSGRVPSRHPCPPPHRCRVPFNLSSAAGAVVLLLAGQSRQFSRDRPRPNLTELSRSRSDSSLLSPHLVGCLRAPRPRPWASALGSSRVQRDGDGVP